MLILLPCFIILQVPKDLQTLRALYVSMSTSEADAIALKSAARQSTEIPSPVKTAYYAAAEMASAKFKLNPVSKLRSFSAGRKILEESVRGDTANIEIRYIRYTIQKNAPRFLGYHQNQATDLAFIVLRLKPLRTSDPELFLSIYAYLLAGSSLTGRDILLINSK